MSAEDERLLEHRLTRIEMDVQIVKQNSVDRLESIMRRFDRQDRLTGMVVSGIFAIALATGGIYLESYLTQQNAVNKHLSSLDHHTPVIVGGDDDDDHSL